MKRRALLTSPAADFSSVTSSVAYLSKDYIRAQDTDNLQMDLRGRLRIFSGVLRDSTRPNSHRLSRLGAADF